MTFGIVDLRGGPGHPRLRAVLARHAGFSTEIEAAVAEILAAVRAEGDVAIRRYTSRFDGIELDALRVSPGEIRERAAQMPDKTRAALLTAMGNVRAFHERQVQGSWRFECSPGVEVGMRVRPLDSVGLYIPGGKACYPSTVVMNAVPAQVAGVRRLAAVTPAPSFRANPVVAGVIDLLGIDEVYLIGGAQAIGALAYGTKSIPAVDKIVGPGNAYVAAAKKQVFGHVAIDAIAGPSEIVVVADATANPAWVAADLLSQAEHDEAASAIAITWDPEMAAAVVREVERQVAGLSRQTIARRSLDDFGAVFLVDGPQAAAVLVDRLAPEHVELIVADPEAFAATIRHAGAIFLGPYSAEVVGDYLAGPNHVLPTNGTARFASPLGTYDFIARTSLIKYDQAAFMRDAGAIAHLADAEGLTAHAAAVRIRMADSPPGGLAGQSKRDPVGLIKPAVRALAPYTLTPYRVPIKLNQNENPHDLPPEIKAEVFRRLESRSWCRYPDFVPTSLLKKLAAHAGWVSEGMLVGNGSNELIQALLAVTVGPGTIVATLDPTFSLYKLLTGVNGGEVLPVPVLDDLSFDVPALVAAARNADIVILCSPNNPTGRQLGEDAVVAILEAAKGLVVLDEAYVEFAKRPMTHLLHRYRHLVILRTFSKAHAMAGLRVGYLLGDPALVIEIAKAKPPYNLNFFSMTAAEVVLEHTKTLEASIAKVLTERLRVTTALESLPGFTPMPTDANFMLVKTTLPPKQIWDGLLERGILIRDVSAHPLLATYFRFNVGLTAENASFLQGLADVQAQSAG